MSRRITLAVVLSALALALVPAVPVGPAAVSPRMARAVALGSSAPNAAHPPVGSRLAARKATARRTGSSNGSTPAAANAWRASPVVSTSTSLPLGSPAKFQPPFACWAARTNARVAAGTARPARREASTA